MTLFYSDKIDGNYLHLEAEEARHCSQVLRKKPGDQIDVVDGKGGYYRCELLETGKKSVIAGILSAENPYNPRKVHLHMAVAPTKNIHRFEWFLEKATEIGVDEITPLLCFHSERRNLRPDRLQKVLVAAMKQSVKAYLPRLNELTRFQDFVALQHNAQAYIAHCQEKNISPLQEKYRPGSNVTILIGPEGDFSKAEIEMAFAQHFEAINLGSSRLRTETAAIVACHTVNLMNEI